jgi:hypothetical protein
LKQLGHNWGDAVVKRISNEKLNKKQTEDLELARENFWRDYDISA